MATSSSSSRGRNGGRGRSRSGRSGGGASSQQAILIGVGAIAVILLLVFLLQGSGTKAGAQNKQEPVPAAPAKPAIATPAVPPPAASPSKRPLKPPKKPAPALSAATLGELQQKLGKIKELHNAGVTARNAGDNSTARSKEGEAKQLIDQWKAGISAQLLWQEEAQMDDWQQPPEYLSLERIYGEYQTLTKKVRMGGG